MIGNLYIAPKEYPCIVVYPSEDLAIKDVLQNNNSGIMCVHAVVRVGNSVKDTQALTSLAHKQTVHIAKKLKINIFCTMPGDVIFLLSKYSRNDYIELWHVIVGEKIGWMIVTKWVNMMELKYETT